MLQFINQVPYINNPFILLNWTTACAWKWLDSSSSVYRPDSQYLKTPQGSLWLHSALDNASSAVCEVAYQVLERRAGRDVSFFFIWLIYEAESFQLSALPNLTPSIQRPGPPDPPLFYTSVLLLSNKSCKEKLTPPHPPKIIDLYLSSVALLSLLIWQRRWRESHYSILHNIL